MVRRYEDTPTYDEIHKVKKSPIIDRYGVRQDPTVNWDNYEVTPIYPDSPEALEIERRAKEKLKLEREKELKEAKKALEKAKEDEILKEYKKLKEDPNGIFSSRKIKEDMEKSPMFEKIV